MDIVTMIMACSLYPDNSVINAMVNINSNNNPLVISGQPFKTETQALADAEKLKSSGQPFTIGLLQIPSNKLDNQSVSLEQLLRPCKNMVIATAILNADVRQCQSENNSASSDEITRCALSTFKTGDPQAGLDYANQILQYAMANPVPVTVTTE